MGIAASRRAIVIAAAGCLSVLVLAGLVLPRWPQGPAPFGLWEQMGRALGTPDDLGAADFPTLTRRWGDGLLCPPDLCAAAQAPLAPPVFTISAERLTQRLRRVALAEWGLVELPAARPDHLRFVKRSALLRLPDVIDARIIARSSGAATLALYARPAVGLLDFGANRRRLERWLQALGA
jgi:uncharacterized protein (DUF1499 family)